jgi:hypothetical protein
MEDGFGAINLRLEKIDENKINEIDNDLARLQEDYYKFKEETNNNIKNILDTLPRKADKDELHQLEAKLLEKLNEML